MIKELTEIEFKDLANLPGDKRKVRVSSRTVRADSIDRGIAAFHKFGSRIVNKTKISSAIIEWPDGSVEEVYVNDIKFLTK